jgi:hypothetical protein
LSPASTVPGFVPAWTAPAGVQAFVTARGPQGDSRPPYHRFNVADHVGDDPAAVAANRARLREGLALPAEPAWLTQVHGTTVAEVSGDQPRPPEADAAVVRGPGAVAAVLTADCLPVLLARGDGAAAAAAHAGWRGLANGVLEATVAALRDPARPADLHAYIGPAIGPAGFAVGREVREAFLAADPEAAHAFIPAGPGRWRGDLFRLARQRLAACGLRPDRIKGGGLCTYSDPARFYSHRRDGRTGRLATLVWLGD